MPVEMYWKTVDCNASCEVSCRPLAQVFLPALVQPLLLCDNKALNPTPPRASNKRREILVAESLTEGKSCQYCIVKLGNETVGKHLEPAEEQKGELHSGYSQLFITA